MDCQEALTPGFEILIEELMAVGWTREEVRAAFVGLLSANDQTNEANAEIEAELAIMRARLGVRKKTARIDWPREGQGASKDRVVGRLKNTFNLCEKERTESVCKSILATFDATRRDFVNWCFAIRADLGAIKDECGAITSHHKSDHLIGNKSSFPVVFGREDDIGYALAVEPASRPSVDLDAFEGHRSELHQHCLVGWRQSDGEARLYGDNVGVGRSGA